MARETLYLVQAFTAGKGTGIAEYARPLPITQIARKRAEDLVPTRRRRRRFLDLGRRGTGRLRRRADDHIQGGTFAGIIRRGMKRWREMRLPSGDRLSRASALKVFRPPCQGVHGARLAFPSEHRTYGLLTIRDTPLEPGLDRLHCLLLSERPAQAC